MPIGLRAFMNLKRPEQSIIQAFQGIPVANIADQMNRLYCVAPAIKPMNTHPLLGSALTVKTAPGDNLLIHKAMHSAQPGDILVIDGGGYENRALIGGLMAAQSVALGLGGWLIDGMIRDREDIEQLSIAVYARGYTPSGPYKNGPGEINVPISIGGQVVMPGDIIVGDADGVVIIRPQEAKELADRAAKHHLHELDVQENIRHGILEKEWFDVMCQEKGLEIIQ